MADISQIKLPNGDTFDLVDEKSGYLKNHIINVTEVDWSDNSCVYTGLTQNDIITLINNNEPIFIKLDNNIIPATVTNDEGAISLRGIFDYNIYVFEFTSNSSGTFYEIHVETPSNISAFTNDSGYITSYTETDPVFSASAAAGISATDISNWNKKVGIDELSIGYVNGNNIYISPSVRFSQQGDSEYSGKFYFVIPSSSTGSSGYNNANTTIRTIRNGTDYENIDAYTFTKSGLYQGYIQDGRLAGVQQIATLSDIPTIPTNVSSFTNDSGYLTLATLPIYDGTVV